jgi:hypothetical protein
MSYSAPFLAPYDFFTVVIDEDVGGEANAAIGEERRDEFILIDVFLHDCRPWLVAISFL